MVLLLLLCHMFCDAQPKRIDNGLLSHDFIGALSTHIESG